MVVASSRVVVVKYWESSVALVGSGVAAVAAFLRHARRAVRFLPLFFREMDATCERDWQKQHCQCRIVEATDAGCGCGNTAGLLDNQPLPGCWACGLLGFLLPGLKLSGKRRCRLQVNRRAF